MALAMALAPPAHAALHTTWHVDSPATMEAVATGPQGSLVAVGARPVGAHGSAAVVKRFTRDGDLVWSRVWPPAAHPNANAQATAVTVTSGGRIYVAGVRSSYRVTGAWFVLAYGPGGRLLHVRRGPNIPDSFASIGGIETRGDRVLLAGTNQGCCEAFIYQGWVETFRPNLTRLWGTDLGEQHPASDLALGSGVRPTSRAGAVARWEPVPVPIPAVVTLTLTKLDLDGDVLWTRDTGVTISEPSGSVAARGGRVMVTAPHRSRAWLGRFAPDGGLVWARTYGARMPTWQQVSIVVDGSSGTWVVGMRRDATDQRADAFVRRFRPDGTVADTLMIEDTIPADATLHGAGIAVVGWSTVEERGVLWQIDG